MIPSTIKTWQMTEPGKLLRTEIPMPELQAGEALVEIKGCGVCHTDLSYLACARKLLAAPEEIYPQFATHNAQTLAAVYQQRPEGP